MGTNDETINHPIFARMWRRIAPAADKRGQDRHRRDLLAGLEGTVVEVGAGLGTNLPHYPTAVTEVIAIEPEVDLIEDVREAARGVSVPVRVLPARAEWLPLEDGSVDAGVVCLVLCSVEDPVAALTELRRVIRPGGELRFYEHVVAERQPWQRLMRIADRLFWTRLAGGCHLGRDTGRAIQEAGFQIESSRRFGFAPAAWMPPPPHILGVARRI